MTDAVRDHAKIQLKESKVSHRSESAETTKPRPEVLAAVAQVAAATRSRFQPIIAEDQVSDSRPFLDAIWIMSEKLLERIGRIDLPEDFFPSVLTAIRRGHDENLHSDCLAGLLEITLCGDAARARFSSLARHPGIDLSIDEIRHLRVRREVRLGALDSNLAGTETGDRRIDLLIESQKLVLVIENKIMSAESEDQTDDYFMAANGAFANPGGPTVRGILLSPSGIAPSCGEFEILSYWQLYRMVEETARYVAATSEGQELYRFYRNELFHLFVFPRISITQEVRDYWKEKKHGY